MIMLESNKFLMPM